LERTTVAAGAEPVDPSVWSEPRAGARSHEAAG